MNRLFNVALVLTWATTLPLIAAEISLESAPPVVVKTAPVAGATGVDPGLTEIRVTFSKPMLDGSWSWSTWGEETYPETTGEPRYLEDQRTCVLAVKLQPGKFYATWLNSEEFKNFIDTNENPSVPYLLTFHTAGQAGASGAIPSEASTVSAEGLNENQRLVLHRTEGQFRSLFEQRTFEGWSQNERSKLETGLIESLKGPQTREYYLAINTLGALHSRKAVPALLQIANDRSDKDCRDRWMATRALGMIGDKSVVPELIHLVYHGNVNTRWWAQISLVRLTGQNFGTDWKAWGKWWNDQGGSPAFKDEFVVWFQSPEQSDPEILRKQLAHYDEEFLNDLRQQ